MDVGKPEKLAKFLEELKRRKLPECLQNELMENAEKLFYLDIKEQKERDNAFENLLMSDMLFQVTASFATDDFLHVDLANVSHSGKPKFLMGDWTSDVTKEAPVEDRLFSRMRMNMQYQYIRPGRGFINAWLDWFLRNPSIPSDRIGKKEWIGGLEFHLAKKGIIQKKTVGGKFAGGPSEWLEKLNSDSKLLDDIRDFMEESKSKNPVIHSHMLSGSYAVFIRWMVTTSSPIGLGELQCPYSEWLLENVELSRRIADKLSVHEAK